MSKASQSSYTVACPFFMLLIWRKVSSHGPDDPQPAQLVNSSRLYPQLTRMSYGWFHLHLQGIDSNQPAKEPSSGRDHGKSIQRSSSMGNIQEVHSSSAREQPSRMVECKMLRAKWNPRFLNMYSLVMAINLVLNVSQPWTGCDLWFYEEMKAKLCGWENLDAVWRYERCIQLFSCSVGNCIGMLMANSQKRNTNECLSFTYPCLGADVSSLLHW
jgi:hypothetical protein